MKILLLEIAADKEIPTGTLHNLRGECKQLTKALPMMSR